MSFDTSLIKKIRYQIKENKFPIAYWAVTALLDYIEALDKIGPDPKYREGKPREWWGIAIGGNLLSAMTEEEGFFALKGTKDNPNKVRVIEYSAYEAVCKERDACRHGMRTQTSAVKERDELVKQLREYELECATINEMRKERDELAKMHNDLFHKFTLLAAELLEARAEVARLRNENDYLMKDWTLITEDRGKWICRPRHPREIEGAGMNIHNKCNCNGSSCKPDTGSILCLNCGKRIKL